MNVAAPVSRTSIVATIIALIVGLGNPALVACNSEADGFQFNDDDMAAAVEGDYAGTLEGKAVTVHLERGDQPDTDPDSSLRRAIDQGQRKGLQCGSRSFVKSASACISTSSLAVNGIITSESDSLPTGTLSGMFTVWGNNLSNGDLTFDQGDRHVLDATFRDGVLRDWNVRKADGTQLTLDVQRVE